MAQVGELKRVIDRAERPVALVDSEPDSQVAGGAGGHGGGGVRGGDPDDDGSGDGRCRHGGNQQLAYVHTH
jgi:hypothetical protein